MHNGGIQDEKTCQVKGTQKEVRTRGICEVRIKENFQETDFGEENKP